MVQLVPKIKIYKKFKKFNERLKSQFGLKFIIFLTTIYFFQEGVIFSLIYLNQLPYYKNVLGINETHYQVFFLIAGSPWSMKALLAVISDLYPLFGFHKISYMFISGLIGSTALSVLSTLRIENSLALIAPTLVFFVMLELSTMDLLCEGQYSKILYEKRIERGDIITWVWIWRVLGQLVGGSIIGTFVTHSHPRNVYWICFALSFPGLFLLLFNFMGERYVRQWYRKFLWTKFIQQIRLFFLAIVIFIAAVGMIAINIIHHKHLVLIYSIGISILLIILGFIFLPLPLAKCNFYIFIQEALYLRIMGALDYFYTSGPACVPNGPHFGMPFYLTVSQVIGCVSGIIGIFTFQKLANKWTFRWAFLFSVAARVVGSGFDIIIVSRLNIRVGVSDRVAFIFGDAIIMDMAFMLSKMPAILLTARLVHRDFESTIYAILAGYHDFGKNVAISMGTSLMMFFGIDFDTTPCEYTQLPLLIALAHGLFPLLAIPFILLLIPNIRMSDRAAFEEFKVDALYGDIQHLEENEEDDGVNVHTLLSENEENK